MLDHSLGTSRRFVDGLSVTVWSRGRLHPGSFSILAWLERIRERVRGITSPPGADERSARQVGDRTDVTRSTPEHSLSLHEDPNCPVNTSCECVVCTFDATRICRFGVTIDAR